MAKLTYRFTKLKLGDGSYVKEPKIPITFIGKNTSLDAIAILDTGSTISYLPLEFASILGFEEKNATIETTKGIGGEEKVAHYAVDIKLTRKNQSVRLKLPVLVFLDPKVKCIIIGLEPFFEKFEVNFKLEQDRIELKC